MSPSVLPSPIPEMVDLIFDLEGETLPASYPFLLWEALAHYAPELLAEELAGVLPLRSSGSNDTLLLPKRAKLAIRTPALLAEHLEKRLVGQRMDIGGNLLHLGSAKRRALAPYPTIHAQLVSGTSDEARFIEHIGSQLGALNIKGKLICGKHHSIQGGRHAISGYSLVIHDLNMAASLHLQYIGLGEGRQFGCGIFVPYKVISGLGEK